MIEKLLKITNPLASSNHGNSPPKIDDSKNVKTTKISTLISSMSLKPAKKRTVIAFPLKPVKPEIKEKSKNELNKDTKISEAAKPEKDVSKIYQKDKKSDNSDSLLDNNSDSKSEETISTENSPSLPIKNTVSESPLAVTTVTQPKRIEVTTNPSSPNLSSSGSFESSSNEESTISTSSSPSSPQKSTLARAHASSGYGSEGYVSENSTKSIETAKITPIVAKVIPRPAIQLNKTHIIPKCEKQLSFLAAKPFIEKKLEPKFVDIRDEKSHCARCHKSFNPNSSSNAEMRCLLPHPTNMVLALGRDANGTNFVCLCCRTEFKLPKMTFYEAGINSMLTGYCFVGQHTSNLKSIDYQDKGGAALSCEEAGCIEFFV